jgi:salicylate hydroxylase
MRTPLGAECEQRFGAPYYTVHRADLHGGLLELLPQGILRLGLRCVRVTERDEEVELEFADGRVFTADVVVGADGIRSVIRQRLVGDAPRFSGQTIYRGLVPAERVPFLAENPGVQLWLGPGQHCVAYPVSRGRRISFGATTAAPADAEHAESWSVRGRTADLLAAYHGWHPQVRALLAAADSVGRWSLYDRDAVPRWSTARITLLGDAAHPMLPFLAQGANQAVEDAVVLAACLRRTGADGVAGALRRYQELRRPRTEEIQRRSRANVRNLHVADGDHQRRRDEDLADGADLSSHQWLYGYDAELAAL